MSEQRPPIQWNRYGDHPAVAVYNFFRSGASPMGLSICARCSGEMHMKVGGNQVLHTHGFIEREAGGQVVCPGEWIKESQDGTFSVTANHP